jgi:hypothetical protein
MSLEVVDGGVLSALKHDQVQKAVISALPVDVVDILRASKFSPDDVFGKPDVVFDALPVDTRNKVALGFRAAIRETGTGLRTELRNLGETGGKKLLSTTLNASDLNSREVTGLLSPETIFHNDAGALPKELTTARTATKALEPRMTRIGQGKIDPTELATLLNAHVTNIHGREGLLQQGFEAPPGRGMEGFYDKILVDYANKYGKKWGAKVIDDKIQEAGTFHKMHSIDITPQMKKSVLEEGQPMFAATAGAGLATGGGIAATQQSKDDKKKSNMTDIVNRIKSRK